MLGFIPSPAHGIVHIGPLQLHAYGLMLAIGVLVAAKIADVRWRRTGHDPKVIAEIAVPGRDRRRDRRPRLPPVHRIQVERGRDRRRVRDLEGRPLDLGRGRRRTDRGRRSSRAAAISTRSRCSTRSRPASSSRRRSAGGATTSTRSCSDGRASCRGRSRSIVAHRPLGLRALRRPSSRRFSTSRSGACSCSARSCGSNTRAGCAKGRRSRCTSRCTRSAASSSSGCASIPRRRSSASASICCCLPSLCVIAHRLVRAARPPNRHPTRPDSGGLRDHPDSDRPRRFRNVHL